MAGSFSSCRSADLARLVTLNLRHDCLVTSTGFCYLAFPSARPHALRHDCDIFNIFSLTTSASLLGLQFPGRH